jgi:hypothetical protein
MWSPSWGTCSHDQLVKKWPAFYAVIRFITVFRSLKMVSITIQMNSVHILPPCCVNIKLILFSHLLLSLASGLFPSDSPTKILYAFLISPHVCYMPGSSHTLWCDHSNNVCWRVQFMELIMQISPASCHFLHLYPVFSSTPFSQTSSICILFMMWVTKFYSHINQQVKL